MYLNDKNLETFQFNQHEHLTKYRKYQAKHKMNLRESRSRREDSKANPNHSQLLYILQNDIRLYIHSFVATDFWITFLLMVLCKEKFLIIGQIENWRHTIIFLLMCLITLCIGNACGIFGAFATSFGSTNNLHSGKYKVLMDSTLLFAYFQTLSVS